MPSDYILIPRIAQGGMVREMRRRADAAKEEQTQHAKDLLQQGVVTAYQSPPPAVQYTHQLELAASIRLPMFHTFACVARNVEVDVVGWSQEDALEHLKRDFAHMPDAEWEWQSGGVAWPGMYSRQRYPNDGERCECLELALEALYDEINSRFGSHEDMGDDLRPIMRRAAQVLDRREDLPQPIAEKPDNDLPF